MEIEELMTRAWDAVKKAGIPDHLQEAAFKEAVDFLRNEAGAPRPGAGRHGDGESSSGSKRPAAKRSGSGRSASKRSGTRRAARGDEAKADEAKVKEVPDADTFYSTLSDESGIAEKDLRDVLQLTTDGAVRVTPPTRKLGNSVAEQAKAIVALVAGARSAGLGENPVDAAAVRAEVDRKRAYQQNNFASKHLGALDGFNAGGRDEIVLTSKWVNEFTAAVKTALGRSDEESEK